MGDIRNKIITISGDPRSGKSTIVRYLIEMFEKMGLSVKVIESGKRFREISQRRYFEKYPDRTDAKQADIQADEDFAKERSEIDKEVDEWLASLGKIINSKDTPNNIYIIDSRLAWFFLKEEETYDLRITVEDEIEAGRRALNDKSKGLQDSYINLQDAIEHTSKRRMLEIERFAKRGINIQDSRNFNFNKDTSNIKMEDLPQLATQIALDALEYWKRRDDKDKIRQNGDEER